MTVELGIHFTLRGEGGREGRRRRRERRKGWEEEEGEGEREV